jgi:hypothetical protein
MPFGRRRSLLGHPIPAGELGPPCGRLTGRRRPDPDGVTAFRTHELRPGWVPPIPRGRRCSSRTEGRAQPAPAAPRRPVLRPCSNIPSAGVRFTRHQRGFTRFTRPVFPSPVAARMERAALGLPPGLRTPPTRSRRRTPRWGQANEHGPGTTRSTSHRSILQSVVHSQRATSRRTTIRSSAARGPQLRNRAIAMRQEEHSSVRGRPS